ncbi:unnamed protein product, partial [Brassica oleracea]
EFKRIGWDCRKLKNEEIRIMFLNSAAEQVRGIIVGKQDMVGKGRIETDT